MADFFMTSTKSMSKIASGLENGEEWMGKEIKIDVEREGGNDIARSAIILFFLSHHA